jgi:hypothetical protein
MATCSKCKNHYNFFQGSPLDRVKRWGMLGLALIFLYCGYIAYRVSGDFEIISALFIALLVTSFAVLLAIYLRYCNACIGDTYKGW